MRVKITLKLAMLRGDTDIWNFVQNVHWKSFQAGPLLFSCRLIQNSIKNIIIILGIWNIDYWRPELVHYQFYKNAPNDHDDKNDDNDNDNCESSFHSRDIESAVQAANDHDDKCKQ